MKNIFILFVLIFALKGISQEESNSKFDKKNELHLNAFHYVVFNWFDISYERVIDKENSIGISFVKKMSEEPKSYNYDIKNSITPYYRHYFSDIETRRFFFEIFMMAVNGIEKKGSYENEDELDITVIGYNKYVDYKDVSLGGSLGFKFMTENGVVFTIFGGVGRNLFVKHSPEIEGRAGMSLGYRF